MKEKEGNIETCRVAFPESTVMCLNIGTPKNDRFSICSKWKINYFRCVKMWVHYSLIILCSNIGNLKTIISFFHLRHLEKYWC